MNTKTCFIIMPFNNRFNGVYDQHIKPLIENQLKSVKCIRMDKHPKIGNIIDHIIKEITGSSFIIADITECNSNVFYEIGFAHALKKDVIFIKNKSLGRLPLDIRGQYVIVYDRDKGYDGLQANIKKVIENSITGVKFNNSRHSNKADGICGIWFGEYTVRQKKHKIELTIAPKKINGRLEYEASCLISIDDMKIYETLQYHHVLNEHSYSPNEWKDGVWIEFIGSSWSNLNDKCLVDYWLDAFAIKKTLVNNQLQVKIWDKVNSNKQEVFLHKSNHTEK